MDQELDKVQEELAAANAKLEEAAKTAANNEQEVSALQRRLQLLEEDMERTETKLTQATTKLEEASKAADESER